MIVVILLIVALAIEMAFRPRLDKTRDGDVLLWYGNKNRKYIIL